jgi:hypothetical protein
MLDADSIPISGSLDAQKIRGIAKTFGFSERTNKAQRGGADLVIVKNQRNSLAHGVSTFSDCGRNYNISELERIKDDVIFFLEDILKNRSVGKQKQGIEATSHLFLYFNP